MSVIENAVVVTMSEVFRRVNRELRNSYGSALVAEKIEDETPSAPAQFQIFEVVMKDRGAVKRIDLARRAKELGVIEPCESVQSHWSFQPPH